MLNIASGGGSWIDYNVSEEMIAVRIGSKIKIGAPALWDYARAKISEFFKTTH
jgi:putative hydrolase of HD superfamily